MQALHVKHIFERLASSTKLDTSNLFFNEDGSPNIDNIRQVLDSYGITANELYQGLALKTEEDIVKESITIARIENVPLGEAVLQYISANISNNVLLDITREQLWDANIVPTIDSYLDPINHTWRPVTGPISYSNNLTNIIPDGVYFTRGIACKYGEINIGVISFTTDNVNTTWRDGLVAFNIDGTLSRYLIVPQDIIASSRTHDNGTNFVIPDAGTVSDIVRIGNVVYLFAIANRYLYKVVEVAPGIITLETLPNFNKYCDSSSTLTLIDSEMYMAFTNAPQGIIDIMKYNMDTLELSETIATIQGLEDELDSDYPYVAAEFLSTTRILIYSKKHGDLVCIDINTGEKLWRLDLASVVGCNITINKVSGISYDPVYNYLYVLTDGVMVRYKCL